MTLAAQDGGARTELVGNNTSGPFVSNFKIDDKSEVEVIVGGVTQTVEVHYVVTGIGGDTFNVVFLDPFPAVGVDVLLLRKQPTAQNSNYDPPVTQLERDLDDNKKVSQQIFEVLRRALKFAKSSLKKDIDVEDPSDGKFAYYDLALNKIKWATLASGGTLPDPVTIARGGTGATTAAGARTNLDVPANAEAILKTIGTTKGDILVFTANGIVVRLAGGTNGHVLTRDSAVTEGVKWAALPAATPETAGIFKPFGGHTVPSGHLLCDGSAVSRTTFSALFAALAKSATITVTIASPGVVTWASHGLKNNDPVSFTTTGALPTGIVSGTTYFIKNATSSTFELSATPGGASINTSGSQSGVHTGLYAPYGRGDGSTTFNVPDFRGRSPFGRDDMGGSAANRITNGVSGIQGATVGAAGGDERLHAHTHGSVVTNVDNGRSLPVGTGFNDNGTSAAAGAGGAQNMPPALICNFIVTTGV